MSTKDKSKAKSSDKTAAPQLVVGIDLGTTNSALAYATPAESGRDASPVSLFEVPQLVNPGEIAEQALLPSFLYIPGDASLSKDLWHCHGMRARRSSLEVLRKSVARRMSTAWLLPPRAGCRAKMQIRRRHSFPSTRRWVSESLSARSITAVPGPSAFCLE